MAVDKAGKKRSVAEIDNHGTWRGSIDYGFDLAAAHDDNCILQIAVAFWIEDTLCLYRILGVGSYCVHSLPSF
ncbi:hypothetical protein [Mycolicibacterium sp. 624]|uniref:hypothetical protein n=1 Tax=Mycolicibacterium sp. 624 TaxID=3156314 RepID=UPI0033953BF4